MGVAKLEDVARFRADDPAALVTASLSCPICLGEEAVRWRQRLEEWEDSVECHCAHCGARWEVYTEPEQALRLELLRAHGR